MPDMSPFCIFLVVWGVFVDLVGLWTMPLLGQCQVTAELIKWAPACGTPESTIVAYLMAVNGVVRALAGLYPNDKGAWYGATSIVHNALAGCAKRDRLSDPPRAGSLPPPLSCVRGVMLQRSALATRLAVAVVRRAPLRCLERARRNVVG